MNFSTVCILGSIILTITFSISAEGLCRHLEFTNPVQGVALDGHMIKNISIGIYASCKHLCSMENHCFSFNLGPPVMGRMVCELSDSDVIKHPGDLKSREGFVYRDTQSNPCPHNATCVNGFTDKRYICQCQAGYTGEKCEKEKWKKSNNAPICFGARDDTYGTFNVKESGLIYTLKLVHRNGSLSCNQNVPASYWGCDHPLFGDQRLSTIITYPDRTALLLADYRRGNLGSCGVRYYTYQLPGIGVNSNELVFNNLPAPLSVSIGQEFQIWYGLDLSDYNEYNNNGQTCIDVYAWYA